MKSNKQHIDPNDELLKLKLIEGETPLPDSLLNQISNSLPKHKPTFNQRIFNKLGYNTILNILKTSLFIHLVIFSIVGTYIIIHPNTQITPPITSNSTTALPSRIINSSSLKTQTKQEILPRQNKTKNTSHPTTHKPQLITNTPDTSQAIPNNDSIKIPINQIDQLSVTSIKASDSLIQKKPPLDSTIDHTNLDFLRKKATSLGDTLFKEH